MSVIDSRVVNIDQLRLEHFQKGDKFECRANDLVQVDWLFLGTALARHRKKALNDAATTLCRRSYPGGATSLFTGGATGNSVSAAADQFCTRLA